MLTREEKLLLLDRARESLEFYLEQARFPELVLLDAGGVLDESRGVFVTLNRDGALRGCVGCIEPAYPLMEGVSRMAVSAALEDTRFPPLRREELHLIDIEISVLSPLREIDDASHIRMGKDGVLVRQGVQTGVFLPQVAVETGWDRETFLRNLCAHKAGMNADAWKRRDCKIYVFSCEVFSEEQMREG